MQQRSNGPGRAPSESINTVDWSRRLGHDQAQLHRGVHSLLAIGGQRPVDSLGRLLHEGDLPAQIALALDNLTDVVRDAGMTLIDLVHLRIHTSDIAAFLDSHFVVVEHLDAHGATTPVTVVEVARLAIPGMEIEIDGLAVHAGPSSSREEPSK